MSTDIDDLPVAVIGAGPIGLAAAVQLRSRGLPVRLYEAGAVGDNLLAWQHVHLFTPWAFNVDGTTRRLLTEQGTRLPENDAYPTAGQLVRDCLEPLARHPLLAASLRTHTRVTDISRFEMDKVVSRGRETRPFALTLLSEAKERVELARAVIDASGTWAQQNPLGANGLPAEGEAALADRISYGIPDIVGQTRDLYEGQATLVAGSGHSAAQSLLDLVALKGRNPATEVYWTTRSALPNRLYGADSPDPLAARAEIGGEIKALVEEGAIQHIGDFRIVRVSLERGKILVEEARTKRKIGPLDRIITATGQRPDLSLTRELRLELDPWLESTRGLGPLIDPNLHSCNSVPPHGHRELSHPEPGFYTAGIKSYGRAPTFLLLTGYEQVRSIAAAIAGDLKAADEVQFLLPEIGVCNSYLPGRAPARDACCASRR